MTIVAQESERRRFDPERTRQDILSAASGEFAEHGLSGARVDAIAARTDTVKRMIYYYFGSKEGLYVAVLEQAYGDIRRSEAALELDRYAPEDAIERLVEFTFDYHEAHPDFIRLVSTENIHHGQHIVRSPVVQEQNRDALGVLERLLQRGKREGVFRPDVDALDIHLMITSFCFFRVSNRYTFGVLFGHDLSAPSIRERHKRLVVEAVLNTLGAGKAG